VFVSLKLLPDSFYMENPSEDLSPKRFLINSHVRVHFGGFFLQGEGGFGENTAEKIDLTQIT
jgi:hypothetical protein